jgi:hypothetical protein
MQMKISPLPIGVIVRVLQEVFEMLEIDREELEHWKRNVQSWDSFAPIIDPTMYRDTPRELVESAGAWTDVLLAVIDAPKAPLPEPLQGAETAGELVDLLGASIKLQRAFAEQSARFGND